MPRKGHAKPITNNKPGFHLNMPISELTEHVTRAIEASDISSTPLVAETTDRATIKDELTLDWTTAMCGGSRKVGLTRRPNAQS